MCIQPKLPWTVCTFKYYFKGSLKNAQLKGTVQRYFLSPIFALMDSSQATYSVYKDFLNLASNSVRYSQFLIESPLFLPWFSRKFPGNFQREISEGKTVKRLRKFTRQGRLAPIHTPRIYLEKCTAFGSVYTVPTGSA
jgi:hypothetical protein